MFKSIERRREYHKMWYQKNRKHRINQIIEYKKRIFEWVKRYKEERGCKYCGEKFWACLEFHHKNKDKEFIISNARNGSGFSRLKKEIEKCDIVCANCHRKIHFLDSFEK